MTHSPGCCRAWANSSAVTVAAVPSDYVSLAARYRVWLFLRATAS